MLKPIRDNVILLREEEEQEGLIVVPDSAKRLSDIAEVVAVGPGERVDGKLQPPDVAVGDRVLINRVAGTEVCDGGVWYTRVNGRDILGIVSAADGTE